MAKWRGEPISDRWGEEGGGLFLLAEWHSLLVFDQSESYVKWSKIRRLSRRSRTNVYYQLHGFSSRIVVLISLSLHKWLLVEKSLPWVAYEWSFGWYRNFTSCDCSDRKLRQPRPWPRTDIPVQPKRTMYVTWYARLGDCTYINLR